jgi:N-acetylmuramidase
MKRETLDKLRSMGMTFGPEYDVLADTLEANRKNSADNAKITKIEYKPTTKKSVGFQHFEVKVTLNADNYLGNVSVVVDGIDYTATKQGTTFMQNLFFATIQIDVSTPEKQKQNFKIAVFLKDGFGIITDQKSKDLIVDTSGFDENSSCYCKKQGLVQKDCGNKGGVISEEMYEILGNEMGVEKGVIFAISKQESKKESFIQLEPKNATILLERHYVYRLIKEKYGKEKADFYQSKYPKLCNEKLTEKGKYGGFKEQIDRLEEVKKWDEAIAIKSCSWGKFQVMGEYLNKGNTYKTSKEFETAMNLCEIQHFQYFKIYLTEVVGKELVKAMKIKNWEGIAELYNGKKWKTTNPAYAKNLKKYYDEYID